ncbi:hypothetical protein GGR56DRAFT_520753 [Xylariaceae sp. FL0804]|nr:hypothetical protein GGR56DRAFT_520753 [Xylariaceae sp. FL0804]
MYYTGAHTVLHELMHSVCQHRRKALEPGMNIVTGTSGHKEFHVDFQVRDEIGHSWTAAICGGDPFPFPPHNFPLFNIARREYGQFATKGVPLEEPLSSYILPARYAARFLAEEYWAGVYASGNYRQDAFMIPKVFQLTHETVAKGATIHREADIHQPDGIFQRGLLLQTAADYEDRRKHWATLRAPWYGEEIKVWANSSWADVAARSQYELFGFLFWSCVSEPDVDGPGRDRGSQTLCYEIATKLADATSWNDHHKYMNMLKTGSMRLWYKHIIGLLMLASLPLKYPQTVSFKSEGATERHTPGASCLAAYPNVPRVREMKHPVRLIWDPSLIRNNFDGTGPARPVRHVEHQAEYLSLVEKTILALIREGRQFSRGWIKSIIAAHQQIKEWRSESTTSSSSSSTTSPTSATSTTSSSSSSSTMTSSTSSKGRYKGTKEWTPHWCFKEPPYEKPEVFVLHDLNTRSWVPAPASVPSR